MRPKDSELRSRLIEVASKHNGLGYPMLHGMLKAERLLVNKKAHIPDLRGGEAAAQESA